MIKRRDIVLIIFGILLVFSIVMLIVQSNASVKNIRFAGTSTSTISNVSIQKFFSLDFSPDLADGIDFGTVADIPTYYQNATENFAGGGPLLNFSNLNITVASNSNTPVDFCLEGLGDMLELSNPLITIGLDNITRVNTTQPASNLTFPPPIISTSLTTTPTKDAANIQPGNAVLYHFWLDVKPATSAGTYENTISFVGVENTVACPP